LANWSRGLILPAYLQVAEVCSLGVTELTRQDLIAALRRPATTTVDPTWTAALALLDESQKARFGVDISEQLLPRLPDPRLKVQIQVARMFLEGKATKKQFDHAESIGSELAMELENSMANATAGGRPEPTAMREKRNLAWAIACAGSPAVDVQVDNHPGEASDARWRRRRLAQYLSGEA
jgi:hypothetical protein